MRTANDIYVDLSALLDLRLGVLNLMSPAFANAVIEDGSYFYRAADAFSGEQLRENGQPYGELNQATFSALRQNLPLESIAKNSMISKVPLLASQLAGAHMQNMIRSGIAAAVRIHYNLWPLKLSEQAQQEIASSLRNLTDEKYEIIVTNIPRDDLTLDVVREKYFALIMYEYDTWFNRHDLEIRKKPIKTACLYVPMLFFGDIATEEITNTLAQLKAHKKSAKDLFEMSSKAIGAFFPIQYVPVAAYCAALPENPFAKKTA